MVPPFSSCRREVPAVLCSDPQTIRRKGQVAEKLVLVGLVPEVIVVDPGDQVTWFSNAGNLKIEFDPQRCPFSSNVFQAPPGVRLQSGAARAGVNPGSYRYRLSINDAAVGQGEILVRAK
jgi:plastocyanin